MTWAKNFVLVPDSDGRGIVDLSQAMAKRFKVPPENCFADKPFSGFNADADGCVQSDAGTKIIICMHGESGVGFEGASLVGRYLERLGVREVGLVAFKACKLGKGDFLHHMAAALDQRRIHFGYLIAYRGNAYLAPKGRMRSFWGTKGADEDRVRIVEGKLHVAAPGKRFIEHAELMRCL